MSFLIRSSFTRCRPTGADDTSGAIAGPPLADVRVVFGQGVNDQDEKSFYHPNGSPSLFIRVWIFVRRCQRIIEDEYRGLKPHAVNP